MLGVTRLLLTFVGVKVFVVAPFWIFMVLLQLLSSAHVRERENALLRTIIFGGVWNGFLLGRVRRQLVPCRFCGAPDHDGHLFWECTFPPLVEIRENPEFHDLMRLDKANWPRCLLWHGWLPMLSGVNGASPWAIDASESAAYIVEVALGRYSSGLISVVDKSRGSKSVEVRRVWEIYDEHPQFMSRQDALLLDDSLDAGDISRAWLVWSGAVESALADAYRFSGGPLPSRGPGSG